MQASKTSCSVASHSYSSLNRDIVRRKVPATGRITRVAATVCRGGSSEEPTLRTRIAGATLTAAMTLSVTVHPAMARLEGVSKPDLLPAEYTNVIDVAGFLTPGEEERINAKIAQLEADTGFKLRVLAQNYPETPGLAIRKYWGVDENSVVFVADPNFGNILNFNVGSNIDVQVPPNFWTRLSSKFGTKKYWSTNGEDTSIMNSVYAIDKCLREPIAVGQCSDIRGVLE
mmetsp:Transcript_35502/g.68059  ORF Transcript_35502/g.68059 Transcript_35502/m.68059 type:complete len:229 (+) Transcript_35502:75-761(+)